MTTTSVPTETYLFERRSDLGDLESRRLHAVADLFDPATRRLLAQVGVARGWRCLEVAAGTGAISVVRGGEPVANVDLYDAFRHVRRSTADKPGGRRNGRPMALSTIGRPDAYFRDSESPAVNRCTRGSLPSRCTKNVR